MGFVICFVVGVVFGWFIVVWVVVVCFGCCFGYYVCCLLLNVCLLFGVWLCLCLVLVFDWLSFIV